MLASCSPRRYPPPHNCSNFSIRARVARVCKTARNRQCRSPTVPFLAFFGTVCKPRCGNPRGEANATHVAEPKVLQQRPLAFAPGVQMFMVKTLRLRKMMSLDFRMRGPSDVHGCTGFKLGPPLSVAPPRGFLLRRALHHGCQLVHCRGDLERGADTRVMRSQSTCKTACDLKADLGNGSAELAVMPHTGPSFDSE